MQRVENKHVAAAFKVWNQHPNITVLGSTTCARVPIVSFRVKHGSSGKYLHWDFVSRLLDQLFGIQTRGGCMCAGPYGARLLGIDEQKAHILIDNLLDNDIIKPGFGKSPVHDT